MANLLVLVLRVTSLLLLTVTIIMAAPHPRGNPLFGSVVSGITSPIISFKQGLIDLFTGKKPSRPQPRPVASYAPFYASPPAYSPPAPPSYAPPPAPAYVPAPAPSPSYVAAPVPVYAPAPKPEVSVLPAPDLSGGPPKKDPVDVVGLREGKAVSGRVPGNTIFSNTVDAPSKPAAAVAVPIEGVSTPFDVISIPPEAVSTIAEQLTNTGFAQVSTTGLEPVSIPAQEEVSVPEQDRQPVFIEESEEIRGPIFVGESGATPEQVRQPIIIDLSTGDLVQEPIIEVELVDKIEPVLETTAAPVINSVSTVATTTEVEPVVTTTPETVRQPIVIDSEPIVIDSDTTLSVPSSTLTGLTEKSTITESASVVTEAVGTTTEENVPIFVDLTSDEADNESGPDAFEQVIAEIKTTVREKVIEQITPGIVEKVEDIIEESGSLAITTAAPVELTDEEQIEQLVEEVKIAVIDKFVEDIKPSVLQKVESTLAADQDTPIESSNAIPVDVNVIKDNVEVKVLEGNVAAPATEVTLAATVTDNDIAATVTEGNVGTTVTGDNVAATVTVGNVDDRVAEDNVATTVIEENIRDIVTEDNLASIVDVRVIEDKVIDDNVAAILIEDNVEDTVIEDEVAVSIQERPLSQERQRTFIFKLTDTNEQIVPIVHLPGEVEVDFSRENGEIQAVLDLLPVEVADEEEPVVVITLPQIENLQETVVQDASTEVPLLNRDTGVFPTAAVPGGSTQDEAQLGEGSGLSAQDQEILEEGSDLSTQAPEQLGEESIQDRTPKEIEIEVEVVDTQEVDNQDIALLAPVKQEDVELEVVDTQQGDLLLVSEDKERLGKELIKQSSEDQAFLEASSDAEPNSPVPRATSRDAYYQHQYKDDFSNWYYFRHGF